MKSYEIKGKKGIDDLKSLFAFRGNSQGDESCSNSIADFKTSEGWMSFQFDCEMTDEAIEKELQDRIAWNNNYISSLIEEDTYGDEYINFISVEEDPLFDNSPVVKGSLESFRMTFLNIGDIKPEEL